MSPLPTIIAFCSGFIAAAGAGSSGFSAPACFLIGLGVSTACGILTIYIMARAA